MKKKKTFTSMAIVIAILILGVGYASITEIPLNLNEVPSVWVEVGTIIDEPTTGFVVSKIVSVKSSSVRQEENVVTTTTKHKIYNICFIAFLFFVILLIWN